MSGPFSGVNRESVPDRRKGDICVLYSSEGKHDFNQAIYHRAGDVCGYAVYGEQRLCLVVFGKR
jgi:hypothetical protein